MAQKRDKPPAPIVRKTPRGLSPVAAFFAEQISADPFGTEYDLMRRTKRSKPQNALYWKVLAEVVAATGGWATPSHLHMALKRACGFTYKTTDLLTGEERDEVDSTAFDAMSDDEFRVYFDTAMQKLAEHVGYDPLAYSVAA